MSIAGRIVGVAAGAAGLAAAGAAVGIARRQHVISSRDDDGTPFGSLRSPGRTVVAADGVDLHVEVDPAEGTPSTGRGRALEDVSPLTVVFVHGYALNLDCFHFQRAAYRGLVRTVFYDQRSHGRSGRSSLGHATIDQLGVDLKQVLDEVVPEGPIVLVGHSMGGMTVIALAEQHPELFGDRILGVGLISTTAGGLDMGRLLLPLMPAKVGSTLTNRAVQTLARGHRAVDALRRAGKSVAAVITDLIAFGDPVPASYVDFVDSMLSQTPFEVVAEFFPAFSSLDKFDAIEVMSRIPTTVICGTGDRLTSISHSRKLHALIEGSTLLECPRAGHLVMLERHQQVNAALDQLISAAAERVPT